MSSTVLVGFNRKVGSYPDKQSGELIPFSNRELLCITDSGSDDKQYFGFAPFQEKMKMKDIAACLHCNPDDDSVDVALKAVLNKNIAFDRAPRYGELQVVGLRVLTK